jgi:hypothetical protein
MVTAGNGAADNSCLRVSSAQAEVSTVVHRGRWSDDANGSFGTLVDPWKVCYCWGFALGFVVMFTIGGLSGVVLATLMDE